MRRSTQCLIKKVITWSRCLIGTDPVIMKQIDEKLDKSPEMKRGRCKTLCAVNSRQSRLVGLNFNGQDFRDYFQIGCLQYLQTLRALNFCPLASL